MRTLPQRSIVEPEAGAQAMALEHNWPPFKMFFQTKEKVEGEDLWLYLTTSPFFYTASICNTCFFLFLLEKSFFKKKRTYFSEKTFFKILAKQIWKNVKIFYVFLPTLHTLKCMCLIDYMFTILALGRWLVQNYIIIRRN